MKTQSAVKTALMSMLLTLSLSGVYAQSQNQDQMPAPSLSKAQKDSVQAAYYQNLVKLPAFVFHAQTALPMGTAVKNLTPDYYDFTVTKDTIIAYLPYYGRAYSAPIDPSKGGIQFTSTNFTYDVTDKKKGGWQITIKVKDNNDIQTIYLSVSASGYTSLQANFVNRQPISFNGKIGKRKGKS
jgi:hypothetical protein